jgi:hypothetical protein
LKPYRTPVKGKEQPKTDCSFYRLFINPIAGGLLSSRAHVPFGLTKEYYNVFLKKPPTIFDHISKKTAPVNKDRGCLKTHQFAIFNMKPEMKQ